MGATEPEGDHTVKFDLIERNLGTKPGVSDGAALGSVEFEVRPQVGDFVVRYGSTFKVLAISHRMDGTVASAEAVYLRRVDDDEFEETLRARASL
jgi:hypothetical protein